MDREWGGLLGWIGSGGGLLGMHSRDLTAEFKQFPVFLVQLHGREFLLQHAQSGFRFVAFALCLLNLPADSARWS